MHGRAGLGRGARHGQTGHGQAQHERWAWDWARADWARDWAWANWARAGHGLGTGELGMVELCPNVTDTGGLGTGGLSMVGLCPNVTYTGGLGTGWARTGTARARHEHRTVHKHGQTGHELGTGGLGTVELCPNVTITH
jgi:hypothetical protein